jgi:hypothetical protein
MAANAEVHVKAKQRLAAWLSQRFFVRFHLSLILGFCLAVGLLTTKGFLALGLETMHWRWPLALVAAYLAFLLCVRVWLAYVGIGRYLDNEPSRVGDVLDVVDGGSGGGSGSGGGGGGSLGGKGGGFGSGGGRFGGGGASGNFASAADGQPTMSMPLVGDSGSSSGGGGSAGHSGFGKLFDGGGGGGDDGILVVLAIAALLAVIFGAGIYLVWQAPTMLAEAAFEGALAGGLVKSIRRVNDPGWVGGTVRASAVPFLLIFVCAMTIASLAERYAPEARTLVEAIHILLQ